MKTLDLDFLADYFAREIKRLLKVKEGRENSIKKDIAVQSVLIEHDMNPAEQRKCAGRIEEAKIVLNTVEPRLEKLREQLEIIEKDL